MKWIPMVQMSATVERDGQQLVLSVGAVGIRQWGVIALETPKGTAKDVRAQLSAVLDNHAHVSLEPQPTIEAAMRLAERYAKWWKGSRATHFKCACKPIKKTRKKAA